jgi:hypothetical protein
MSKEPGPNSASTLPPKTWAISRLLRSQIAGDHVDLDLGAHCHGAGAQAAINLHIGAEDRLPRASVDEYGADIMSRIKRNFLFANTSTH